MYTVCFAADSRGKMDLRLSPVFYSQVLHLKHSMRPSVCVYCVEERP